MKPKPDERDARLNPYLQEDNLCRAMKAQRDGRIALEDRQYAEGCSVVILTLNKPELIQPLLHKLIAAKKSLSELQFQLEIIVGDTGSTDAAVLALYAELAAEITLVRDLQYHFSRCNNQLFSGYVKYDRTLFLNNDIVFASAADAIRLLAREAQPGSGAAVAGCYLLYPDGAIQHAGCDFFVRGSLRGLPFHPLHGQRLTLPAVGHGLDCAAVTGACLMVQSAVFQEIGGFDEGYATECQDIALCLAAHRLGNAVRLINAGSIVHLENATRPKGSEDWADRQRFVRKWSSYVEAVWG